TTSTSVRLPSVAFSIVCRSFVPPTVSFAITRMRCASSSRVRGAVRTGCSRRRFASQATRPAVRTTNTATPSHVATSEAPTISAKYAIVSQTKRYASASLRNGFGKASPLQQVDRRVDDDPHYVDEVPVDSRDLDAMVGLRREVAPEGPDRHERQD